MQVTFNGLCVKNFRQITDREFKFDAKTNYIIAQNGAGKTNLFHAITWCLFGKDFSDRTRFEIVPLNPDNTQTGLEPDVSLTLTVEGKKHELRRELKNGKATQTYIDGAPCETVKEYDDFVAQIFSSQDRFKMYTNPLYFPEMHWKEQRKLFMQFFPLPKNEEVLNYLSKKKVQLRSDLADHLIKLSPEKLQDKIKLDQDGIESDRTRIRNQITLLDDMLDDAHTFDDQEARAERDALRKQVAGIQEEIARVSQMNAEVAQKKSALEELIRDAQNKMSFAVQEAKTRHQDKMRAAALALDDATRERDRIAERYVAIGAVIDTTCPTCGQPLPDDQVRDLQNKQTAEKRKLAEQGKLAAQKIAEAKAALEKAQAEKPEQVSTKDYEAKIANAQKEIIRLPALKPIPAIDQAIIDQIDKLSNELAHSEDIQDKQKRRKKLLEEERELNRRYEACENILLDLTDFFFYRSQMVVNAVNKSFKAISVKVLEIRRNGEPKETFEILKDGVPYSELNTAGQLLAGLELSNFLKKKLNVSCPVLIDNGERYTDVDLSKLDGQLICAVATKGQKLEIVNKL